MSFDEGAADRAEARNEYRGVTTGQPITTQPVIQTDTTGGANSDLGASYWLTHPEGGIWAGLGSIPAMLSAAVANGGGVSASSSSANSSTADGSVALPQAPNLPQPIMTNAAASPARGSGAGATFAISLGAAILAFWIWEKAKAHHHGGGK